MEEEPRQQPPEHSAIEDLPASLGYIESAEAVELRTSVIEAMKRGDYQAIKDHLAQYQIIAEQIVSRFHKDDYAKAQIGLIVSTGLMWREAGMDNAYGAELVNAKRYADNMNFSEIHSVIEHAFKSVEQAYLESRESDYSGPPTEEILSACKRELPPELGEELDELSPLPPDEVLEEVAALMLGYDLGEPYEFFQRMGWVLVQPSDSHPEGT